jgi:hypothetical protein
MPPRRRRATSPGPVQVLLVYNENDANIFTSDVPVLLDPSTYSLTGLDAYEAGAGDSPKKRQRKAATTGRKRPNNRIPPRKVVTATQSAGEELTTITEIRAVDAEQDDLPIPGDDDPFNDNAVQTWSGTDEFCGIGDQYTDTDEADGYGEYADLTLLGGLGFTPISLDIFVVQGWDGKRSRGTVSLICSVS